MLDNGSISPSKVSWVTADCITGEWYWYCNEDVLSILPSPERAARLLQPDQETRTATEAAKYWWRSSTMDAQSELQSPGKLTTGFSLVE
jgi:hypothetical protein